MEQGTGIDLHYLSPQEGKIIDVGTSVCTGAGNLPLAGCILMGSLPFLRKKKRYLMASLLFGAGYGNRTRLRGLGSHYNSRYTNPAMCGYYSKWKRKIQPLFVDTKMRGQVSYLPPVLIKPLPGSDAWVWHRWTAPRFCLLSLPSAWERS